MQTVQPLGHSIKEGGLTMVIAEYQFGQTKIRIHDDCMAKTREENQKIVDRITEMVTKHYQFNKLQKDISKETA